MTVPVSGATRVAAVIGDPVRHSRSPAIHNAAFAALGLDWVYVAFPVARGGGAAAVAAMRALGIDALSVTMPHKDDVAAAVDRRTPAVESLGAANCVWRDGDVLVGDNTDGDGWVASFESAAGTSVADAHIVVVGAGGAARSIIEACGRNGAERIVVVNRSSDAAARAAAVHPAAEVGEIGAVTDADLVVNATVLGMAGGPAPDESPIPHSLLRPDLWVADIVYQPRRTPLLVAAEAAGARTVEGIGMLVHQAGIAFRHWTGLEPPLDVMADAVGAPR